jgi:hypothetical protein
VEDEISIVNSFLFLLQIGRGNTGREVGQEREARPFSVRSAKRDLFRSGARSATFFGQEREARPFFHPLFHLLFLLFLLSHILQNLISTRIQILKVGTPQKPRKNPAIFLFFPF